MTTVAKNSTNSTKINYNPPKENFRIISNELIKLCVTGCEKASAAAYQTYCYIISLHPNSIITPKKISESLQSFAEKTGGKPKSKKTIRTHLDELESVGLITSEIIRDKKGCVKGVQFYVFSYATDSQKREIDNENEKSNIDDNLDIENTNSTDSQKRETAYNKERVITRSKRNSNSNSTSSAEPSSLLDGPEDATALLEKIKSETDNEPMIGDDLVERSLEKFGPEYTLELIRWAKELNPQNPGAPMNEPSRIYYPSIDARLKSKTTVFNKAETIKNDREHDEKRNAEFLELLKDCNDNKDLVSYYIDNLDFDGRRDVAKALSSENSYYYKILKPAFGSNVTNEFIGDLLKKPKFIHAISKLIERS